MKKLVALFTCIALFALILTMFAAFVKPVKAAENVILVGHQGFLDSTGSYVVYGEVKNTGDEAATNVYLKITFYDSSNAVLDEGEVSIKADVLLPGRKAPFGVLAGVEGTKVNSYKVELMDLTMSADNLPIGLEIVSSSAEVKTAYQSVMLNGQVKNSGTQTANYVKVIVTLYDGPSGTGNVVGAASASTDPSSLNSGQTGTFQTGIPVGSGKSYVSYVITAQSLEYTTEEYVRATGGQPSATSTPTPSASPTASPSQPASSSTPTPSGTTNTGGSGNLLIYIVIAVVAIVAVLAGVMFIRKRGSKAPQRASPPAYPPPPPPPT